MNKSSDDVSMFSLLQLPFSRDFVHLGNKNKKINLRGKAKHLY